MKTTAFSLLGGAAALVLSAPALAEPMNFEASLAGEDGGHPDGSGMFTAEIDAETGDVCYTLAVDGIGDPVAAHIHAGAAGKTGKPVVSLEVTGEEDDLCVAEEPSVLEPIVAEPAKFYVNVHTAEHPAGAIRGQLAASAGGDEE